MNKTAIMVGGGIVGISCGLALQDKGYLVSILEKDKPGQKASRWNAGEFASTSLVPLNNPDLFAEIPRMLMGKLPGVKIDWKNIHKTFPWCLQFLQNCTQAKFEYATASLNDLIKLSRTAHNNRLNQVKAKKLQVEQGLLFLFQSDAEFNKSALNRNSFDKHDVTYECLDGDQICEIEPHLKRRFSRAILSTGSASIIDPELLVQAYLRYFKTRGGKVEQVSVSKIEGAGSSALVVDEMGGKRHADCVVIAAGSWSAELLRTINRKLPMISERGYIQKIGLIGNAKLNRPIFDIAGGMVISPRVNGDQISTGTELTVANSVGVNRQLADATSRAQALTT